MSLTEAYAPERAGRRWMHPSSDYAGGFHRGQDWRKQNDDQTASVVTDVIAISDGIVDWIGRPNDKLGPTIRIRRDAGGYEFHSHSIASVEEGTRTAPGTRLGRNARLDERPGQISGVHDHIVFSDHADGAWNTDRRTRNPAAYIAAALVAAAHTTPKPHVPKEDTMTQAIKLNGKHLFAVGEEFISHHGTGTQATITRNVMSATDEEHKLDTGQFHDLLDGLGIPRSVVNIDTGAVLNPETGQAHVNGVWSRRREAVAKLDQLLTRK